MDAYDPLQAPDLVEWLALDESERIALVEGYHVRTGVELPNRFLHSAIHAVVENQLASGELPEVGRTLARLLAGGLDRHEAVHAIGSVVAEHMFKIPKVPEGSDQNEAYCAGLERLTAEKWRSS